MSGDAFLGHRLTYDQGQLSLETLDPDPVRQLKDWLLHAEEAGVIEPSAMALSTATMDGQPHVRFLLLRYLDEQGLVFFTNYESDKGQQLAQNPNAAVAFWWPATERQVRVEGIVAKITDEESDAYFASRPYESQIASAASPQSQPIKEGEIEQRMATLREAHPDHLPRPTNWGGYRLTPTRFEFWQGRPARNHARFVYARTGDGWNIFRIAP